MAIKFSARDSACGGLTQPVPVLVNKTECSRVLEYDCRAQGVATFPAVPPSMPPARCCSAAEVQQAPFPAGSPCAATLLWRPRELPCGVACHPVPAGLIESPCAFTRTLSSLVWSRCGHKRRYFINSDGCSQSSVDPVHTAKILGSEAMSSSVTVGELQWHWGLWTTLLNRRPWFLKILVPYHSYTVGTDTIICTVGMRQRWDVPGTRIRDSELKSFQAGFVTDLHGLGWVIWTRLHFLHQ